MELFIPPLKTKLYLLAPWTFGLHYEKRNRGLWNLLFSPPEMASYPSRWRHGFQDVRLATLEKGTNLVVDRIFIRQGAENYNSVSFRGDVSHMGVIRKVRFWAKLADVNKIKCKVI
jgi:hypothetical protein